MNAFAQVWSAVLPLRWYMAVLFEQAARGLPVHESGRPFAILAALAVAYALLALLRLRAIAEAACPAARAMPAPEPAARPSPRRTRRSLCRRVAARAGDPRRLHPAGGGAADLRRLLPAAVSDPDPAQGPDRGRRQRPERAQPQARADLGCKRRGQRGGARRNVGGGTRGARPRRGLCGGQHSPGDRAPFPTVARPGRKRRGNARAPTSPKPKPTMPPRPSRADSGGTGDRRRAGESRGVRARGAGAAAGEDHRCGLRPTASSAWSSPRSARTSAPASRCSPSRRPASSWLSFNAREDRLHGLTVGTTVRRRATRAGDHRRLPSSPSCCRSGRSRPGRPSARSAITIATRCACASIRNGDATAFEPGMTVWLARLNGAGSKWRRLSSCRESLLLNSGLSSGQSNRRRRSLSFAAPRK